MTNPENMDAIPQPNLDIAKDTDYTPSCGACGCGDCQSGGDTNPESGAEAHDEAVAAEMEHLIQHAAEEAIVMVAGSPNEKGHDHGLMMADEGTVFLTCDKDTAILALGAAHQGFAAGAAYMADLLADEEDDLVPSGSGIDLSLRAETGVPVEEAERAAALQDLTAAAVRSGVPVSEAAIHAAQQLDGVSVDPNTQVSNIVTVSVKGTGSNAVLVSKAIACALRGRMPVRAQGFVLDENADDPSNQELDGLVAVVGPVPERMVAYVNLPELTPEDEQRLIESIKSARSPMLQLPEGDTQLLVQKSGFQQVSDMNEAFGNPKGDPHNINWDRVARQNLNIADELKELFVGLGGNKDFLDQAVAAFKASLMFSIQPVAPQAPDLEAVRDAGRDVVVFADGGAHMMGVDADRDMEAVVEGVMSRFIRDEDEKQATIALHAAKGVTDVYFEGTYPRMVMKSASDQPDAPKGKFLKSAGYSSPKFYQI